MEKFKRNLIIQIWELYSLNSLDNVVFTDNSSEHLKDSYILEERKDMYEALQWAEQHPDFHFESIMKKAPVVGKLKFSNQEVYQYLMLFKTFMEDPKYSLLTDNRPTLKLPHEENDDYI